MKNTIKSGTKYSLESVRFWSKVDKNGPIPKLKPELGRCWVWTAYKTKLGYGNFRSNSKTHLSHRWSFSESIGSGIDGAELDHVCRNPSCVRPSHLEIVTHQENMRRAEAATGSARLKMLEKVKSGWLPPAVEFQRRKTHCPSGHPYNEENTCHTKSGRRSCRACALVRYHRTKPASVISKSMRATDVLFLK